MFSSAADIAGGRTVLDQINGDFSQQRQILTGMLLSDAGCEVFAPTDSGWGAIIAHCTDRFGVTWLMNYDKPQS